MEYRNIIAILVILFYGPALVAAGYLIWRHGWRASYESWFVLSTFSLSRIAYGALQLSTIAHPTWTGLHVAAATFAVDGIAALLFCELGLLHRLLDNIQENRAQPRLTLRHLRVLEIIITAAFVCASIGFSELTEDDVTYGLDRHPPTSRAASIMYVVGFAGIILSTVLVALGSCKIDQEEMAILWVLLGTQPLLLVRLLYLCLDVLGDIPRFSSINGSVTIFLCMGLLEEAGVLAIFLVLGYQLRVLPQRSSKVNNSGWFSMTAPNTRRPEGYNAGNGRPLTA